MAARLGERRGNPTGANQYGEGKPQEIAEYHAEETRDLAAEHAGFGNHETYRQARALIDGGLSQRQAAKVLGVGQSKIRDDLSGIHSDSERNPLTDRHAAARRRRRWVWMRAQ